MTPGARVAAAIEILHDMTDGLAAEQALTRWARRSRFAGSKDRAAIRDHVFDVSRDDTPGPREVGLHRIKTLHQSTSLRRRVEGDGTHAFGNCLSHASRPLMLNSKSSSRSV